MRKIIFLTIILLVLVVAISLRFYSFNIVKNSNFSEMEENRSVKNEKELKANPIHWSSNLSPNGLYRGDSFTYDYKDRYNYYRLFITNLPTGQVRKIYSGDFRTLGWEWTEDNRIKIFYNCGTGCRASKTININESISIADYKNGGMSEENGWKVEFFKSF